jgi:hypothetical protein
VNKKSPLTAHLHAGRLFAPNYHPDYAEKVKDSSRERKDIVMISAIPKRVMQLNFSE